MKKSFYIRFWQSRITGWILLLLLAIFWEIFSQLGVINSVLFPPLTKIIAATLSLIVSLELPKAVGITLGRCASGYLMAALIAIPLGIIMGQSKQIYFLLEPLIEILRPIPSAAIIPVAILFLGIDNEMKIAVIMFGSLWPILLNTISGVQTIDSLLIDTGKTFNLNRTQLLFKILIPAALPSITIGLRISLAISLILAITIEMIVGGTGLGFLILDYERSFKYPFMYSGIITLGFIGFLLNFLFVTIENKYLSWSKK